MNINSVFWIVLLSLIPLSIAYGQVPQPQLIEISPIKINPPDIEIHVATVLQQVELTTNNFIDSVRTNFTSNKYLWYTNNVNISKEIHCLAQNIYYEARGESLDGKLAIVDITINRVKSFQYPLTICGVVWQPFQFSWTSHHMKYKKPHDKIHWQQAVMIATAALNGGRLDNVKDITDGATNFHATSVHPKWKRDHDLEKTVKIGHHIFYRLKQEIVASGSE